MTDKTMAKLRTLLKGYAERVAKLQPQPKATDEKNVGSASSRWCCPCSRRSWPSCAGWATGR